jgi:hypothetical protein
MKKFLFLLPVIFFIACAGTNFKWDSIKNLHLGMTKQEVVEILGSPYQKTAIKTSEGIKEIYTWAYAEAFSAPRAASVTFLNDQVVTIVLHGSPNEYKD